MKTGTKIIISLAVFLALAIFYGISKAKSLVTVFEKITIRPVSFSNLDISWQRIKLNVDVVFENPTDQSLDISGFGLAVLKRVRFYYNNKYIATADINLSQIYVPENDTLTVPNIPVEIPLRVLIENAIEISNFNVDFISVDAIISVAGNEVLIDNQ